MKLNEVKEAALLSWINSVYPEEPFTKIIQMMDDHRLLKFAYRVQGKDFCDGLLLSPFPNVMEVVFSMLQADFQFSPRQASLMLQKISQGMELELQLAKVVLVLCYCGFKTYNMVPLDTKTGLMIASMFHFVEDDADGLSLDEGLDRFLTKASVMTFSTSSSENSCYSPLYTDDESPIFSRVQNPPRVQFQEHFTVACSSVSSPVQDVMSTPQLLKRLRKVLAREGDVRVELEKDLANQISINLEKEGVISQLQHRVERMLREQGELENDHKAALLELQEKNESLICRVHEVAKQCQDLKTENTQKKKMIDVLTQENQTFAAQPTVGLPSFTLTDEDLRMGDPKETILRAALNLHESLRSQTLRQPGSLLHDLNTPEQYIGTDEAKKLASCISRTVMLKSRHANSLSNAEPKRRQSVMFTIVNTPKHQRGSLLQRGLKRRKEACKSPTVGSRALRPAMSAANSRSPLSLRKCPRNESPKKVTSFSSRIICGQNLDLFLSIIFVLVCFLFTL
ncbi:hypothetical protein G5714_015427 [Onychostoma macrolepis]|uniref:Nuclear mitotic apparatus protein 1 N-terminal hook domain-containing protein n=1 Tax=Onychostoma macrolepis TaxID=369639 RepID=A0A7J6CB64_9TELE|nr:hypothetical protein G5714_015427 [Onychostoma macrolepis]